MSQRKSDNRTNKYCTGCGKTTAHDVCGQGTIACRQCGHTLGNPPAKPSRGKGSNTPEPDPGEATYRLHTWPYNSATV